jgi:hypothetical protein
MAAIEDKLGIINGSLRALGQDKLTSAQLMDLEDDNAIVCNDAYDPVRLTLLRQYPFEFCTETLPLVKIDPAGFVIAGAATAAVNGAFDADWAHEDEDVVVTGGSGAWVIGNAAGTETYYTSADEVSNPWEISQFEAGDYGSLPAPRIYPGTPRDFAFLYKRPEDCLTPWAIWNPSSRKPDNKIRFKPFRNEWIATDQDGAVLVYARDEEDVTLFDALFVMCFMLALAVEVYPAIKGMDKGIGLFEQKLAAALNTAKKIDASEQHEDRKAVVGRRYLDI